MALDIPAHAPLHAESPENPLDKPSGSWYNKPRTARYDMTPNKELIGASTGLLVLSVLAKEANYGYQIIRRLNEQAGDLFEWREGTVYPVLHKLEKEELVRAQWQQAETGRERKYYYITGKGREALAAGKEQWHSFYRMILQIGET